MGKPCISCKLTTRIYRFRSRGADPPLDTVARASPFLCPCVDPMAMSGYRGARGLLRRQRLETGLRVWAGAQC